MTTSTEATITVENYHASPGVSHSRLELFRRRRRLYHAIHVSKAMPPAEPTDAMRLGSLVDLLVLTPDKADERIAVRPPCDRRTKAGKATWEEFCREANGRLIVEPAEMAAARAMQEAVMAHPVAARLLGRGEPQTIIEWTDEETGLECRSMRDWWNEAACVLVDLKTARSAAPRDFASQAAALGYLRQQAMYVQGHHALTGYAPAFCFIVVETAPPHPVAVYEFSPADVAAAHCQNEDDLRALAKCMETDDWREPWEVEAKVLGLPRWVNYEHEWEG